MLDDLYDVFAMIRRLPITVTVLALTVIAVLAISGCGGGSKAPESSGPVKQYTMRGDVLTLDPDHQTATIRHEEIKGWMGAMTMEYQVKEKPEFAKLHAGDHITATVYVQGDDYWIGQIRPGR